MTQMTTNGTITALKIQKRNPKRVNVHLDGKFAFGLASILAAELRVGQELSRQQVDELQSQDAIEVAYLKALNFISYRPRAEKEIIRNLQKHEVPEGQIEQVLTRLRQNDLADDPRFAQLWVENRSTFRPRGRYALRHELRQKGVGEKVIEAALQDLDESQLAYRAASKKAGKLGELEWPEFRRKLYGHLSRRGFSYEIIANVIPVVWEERTATQKDNNHEPREVPR